RPSENTPPSAASRNVSLFWARGTYPPLFAPQVFRNLPRRSESPLSLPASPKFPGSARMPQCAFSAQPSLREKASARDTPQASPHLGSPIRSLRRCATRGRALFQSSVRGRQSPYTSLPLERPNTEILRFRFMRPACLFAAIPFVPVSTIFQDRWAHLPRHIENTGRFVPR